MIALRDAEPGDTQHLTLRAEDAREVRPGWQQAVEREIRDGTVVAYWDGSDLVALWGITVGPDFWGPWLLASDHIEKHQREAVRRARRAVRHLKTLPRTVGNYIGKHATSNRKFVEALGFVIIESPSGDHDFFYLPKHV